jgi:tetratricopeptide (TPR) repeat protein
MSTRTVATFAPRFLGGLLILGAVFVPLDLSAQATGLDARERADVLHARAMTAATFVNHIDDVRLIAQMHEESAALRDGSDPRAFDCWRMQARLLYATGEYDQAVAYLKDAAEVALNFGSPGPAAHTLLDAAAVLDEQGRQDEAQALIRRAQELTTWNELTSSDQRRIEQRIAIR